MKNMVQITLGRLETETVLEPGLNFAVPERVERPVPRALVWLRAGTEADVEEARSFAADEGWEVFTLPLEVNEPLEETKRILMERIKE